MFQKAEWNDVYEVVHKWFIPQRSESAPVSILLLLIICVVTKFLI